MAADSTARGLAECLRATAFCVDAMAAFQDACAKGDWATAEVERMKIIAATENYLDQLMALHRAFLGRL
jgi:hypothetical protein